MTPPLIKCGLKKCKGVLLPVKDGDMEGYMCSECHREIAPKKKKRKKIGFKLKKR